MRFKSIDALRGMAATLVVFYHLWNRFYPGLTSQRHAASLPHGVWATILFFLFGFGYLGVDLFFVLSGFCIHLPQALKFNANGSDRLSLPKFARRRFWRLYPAYAASLVWTSLALLAFPLLAKLMSHKPIDVVHIAQLPNLLYSAFFLQQFHPAAFGFNGVYWTLIYEVQFYLCYPLLLLFCRRWGFLSAGVILLLIEIGCLNTSLPVPDLFVTRYFEWFLGMYLAELTARRRSLMVPVWSFVLVSGMALASVFHPATWLYRDLVASGASVLLLSLCLEREVQWPWLAPKWLVSIGVFSYSLYLVHIPVIDLVWEGLRLSQNYVHSLPQMLALISVPVAIGLGYVFFRLFEKPFLGESKKREPLLAPGSSERSW